jgi:hypothetical protein
MKKTTKKTAKKNVETPAKIPSLLAEATKRKMEAQKSGKTSESLRKFKPTERNKNNSNVGPSWGGRKGN